MVRPSGDIAGAAPRGSTESSMIAMQSIFSSAPPRGSMVGKKPGSRAGELEVDAVGTAIAVQQKLMRLSDIRRTLNFSGFGAREEFPTAACQKCPTLLSSAGSPELKER